MILLVLFAACICVADSSTSLCHSDQGASVSKLSSTCVSYIENDCPLTRASCVEQVCSICTALGITPSLEPCCQAPTPTKCFINNYVSGVTSSGASIIPPSLAPSILSSSLACKTLGSILYSCQAATQDFTNLYFTDQQSCLCSTRGVYAPDYYDDAYSSCLAYASKYDPPEYSQLGPIGGGQFSGTYSGIAISHALGSTPCHAFFEYTQTATPRPVSSHNPKPAAQTSLRSQGGIAMPFAYEPKYRKILVVVITNLYLVLQP